MSEFKEGDKQIANCEIHGEFIKNYSELFKKFFGCCETCAKARDDERKGKEQEEENERIRVLMERRRINAGVSQRNLNKTFDDYICESGSNKEKAKSKFMKLSESVLNGSGFNIIGCGGVGTGKTLLSSALIDSIVDKKSCELITTMDLCRALKDTWKRDSEQSEGELLNYFKQLDLLIIDEIGVQFGSETEKLFIFDIINGRYDAMKPSVLLSNLSIELIKEIVGERVIDRLRDDSGQLVIFDWESMRGAK